MIIKEVAQVAPEPVMPGVTIRWVLTQADGVPNYVMRVIELAPGTLFKPHHHPYEHEIYVLEGEGVLLDDGGEVGTLRPGLAVFVPPDVKHGYKNTGTGTLKFICVIPAKDSPR